MVIFWRTLINGHFSEDAHREYFSHTLMGAERTAVLVRTVMEANFCKDAHGRSF